MSTARPAAPQKAAQPKGATKASAKAAPAPLSIQDYLRKILLSLIHI